MRPPRSAAEESRRSLLAQSASLVSTVAAVIAAARPLVDMIWVRETEAGVFALNKLLQAALNAGVNQSSGLQFEVSDPARGRDQAMRAAR